MRRETGIIQLMLAPGIGARSLGKLMRRLASEEVSIEDFVALAVRDLEYEYGIPQISAEGIGNARNDAEELAETLAEHDIQMIGVTDSSYPQLLERRLGRTAPPVLFVRGEIAHTNKPMIGFAGVRECSEDGAAVTRDLASALAGEGANIVSGYAPGIDSAAHFGALTAGGVTTAVLASGILHFAPRPELGALCDDTNMVIVSEFFPTMPWKSHSAMQRNRTICAMSRGMVIVESGLTGGTFAAGMAALEIGCPLYVVTWPSPTESSAGNGELVLRGGRALAVGSEMMVGLQACLKGGISAGVQSSFFE